MNPREHTPPVRIGLGVDGSRTYLVDCPPEDLPSVRSRDIERAWYAAREAAIASIWGVTRGFRFQREDGTTTDMALTDRDARCWAAAVDVTVGLGTCYGLSLCLRLLALIDLLARAPWAGRFCRLERDGAELEPALLRAASTTPLSTDARFEEGAFRARLGPLMLNAPAFAARLPA